MRSKVSLSWTHPLLAIVVLALAGCASGPPKPVVDYDHDYDFDAVQTVAFYHNSGQVSGDNPLRLSDIERNRVNGALEQALEKKGLQFVEDASKADMLLSWHLATQDKTDVRTYQTPTYGYGYGPYDRYSMYSCWHCTPYRTEVSVTDYTEGTFIVDMIDPGKKQSVWRGTTQSRLKDKPNQDQTAYNEAADVIFQNFPPIIVTTASQ